MKNRSMQIKGTFKTNMQLLWDVWTKPEHLKNWWGPKGFSATQIDWTILFDTPEMRETIVKVHNAEKGQKENMERLGEYLSELSTD